MPSVRFMIHRAERFPSIVKLQMEGVQGEVRYVRERTCKLRATTAGWSCSACHVVSWQTSMKPKPSYCPRCGAKVVDE